MHYLLFKSATDVLITEDRIITATKEVFLIVMFSASIFNS